MLMAGVCIRMLAFAMAHSAPGLQQLGTVQLAGTSWHCQWQQVETLTGGANDDVMMALEACCIISPHCGLTYVLGLNATYLCWPTVQLPWLRVRLRAA